MIPWQSDFVEVNGLRLHYTRTGGELPPLVLAHGFSDDGACWGPVARALEGDYDVIMPDARGHGRSDGPEGAYDPPTLAEDLAGVIAALNLARPAILGHSMGAATTLALAAQHPHLPGAILLEDPPAIWMPPADEPFPEERMAGMRAWAVAIKRKTRDELLAEARATADPWPDDELEPWADAKLRLSFNAISRSYAPPPAVLTAGSITCPALLITAETARGALVSPEQAEALRVLLPQLQIVYIPHAGHSIRRDQRTPYLEVVRDFLLTAR